MSFSLHSSTENLGGGRRSSSSGSNSSSSWSVSVKSLMGLMSWNASARPRSRNQSNESRWMAIRSGSSRTSSRLANEYRSREAGREDNEDSSVLVGPVKANRHDWLVPGLGTGQEPAHRRTTRATAH